jgi:hypothetical protein
LDARPQYYAAALWKKLMGSTALAVSGSGGNLRAFAHCTANDKSSVTVLVVNTSPKQQTVNIPTSGFASGVTAQSYVMSGSGSDPLASRDAKINGKATTLGSLNSPADVSLGKDAQRLAQVVLPAYGAAFVVLRGAQAKACA